MKDIEEVTFQEWTFEQGFPAQFQVQSSSVEKKYRYTSPPSGTCYSQQIALNEILISYSCICSDQPVHLEREITQEGVEMIFVLKGHGWHTYHGTQQALSDRQHNLYFNGGGSDTIAMNATEGYVEVMVIRLSPDYYFRRVDWHSAFHHQFTEKMTRHESTFLCEASLDMVPTMNLLINEICTCHRPLTAKRIFLEAKVLELLVYQVEQAEQEESGRENNHLSSYDLSRLSKTKKILEENISRPPTIQHLARGVGMNESQLKKGFKETTGMTIFRYVHQLRMQRARHLLSDKKLSVSETADQVGYKNPQHFTAAFKKYYGTVPSNLKT